MRTASPQSRRRRAHGRLNGTAPAEGAAVALSIPSEAVDVSDTTMVPEHRDRLPGRLVSRLLIGTAVQLTIALSDGQVVTLESHASKYPRRWAPGGVTLA